MKRKKIKLKKIMIAFCECGNVGATGMVCSSVSGSHLESVSQLLVRRRGVCVRGRARVCVCVSSGCLHPSHLCNAVFRFGVSFFFLTTIERRPEIDPAVHRSTRTTDADQVVSADVRCLCFPFPNPSDETKAPQRGAEGCTDRWPCCYLQPAPTMTRNVPAFFFGDCVTLRTTVSSDGDGQSRRWCRNRTSKQWFYQ